MLAAACGTRASVAATLRWPCGASMELQTNPRLDRAAERAGTWLNAATQCLGRVLERLLPGYRAASKHNSRLLLFIGFWLTLAVIGLLIAILASILGLVLQQWTAIGIGAVWTVYGALLSYAVSAVQATMAEASKRLATVDLLIAEISATCTVISNVNLAGQFVALHDVVRDAGAPLLRPQAFEARAENYMEIFGAIAADVGSLPSRAVNDVTRFYTYLKASRDATRSLALWGSDYPAAQMQTDVLNILALVALCLKYGRRALEALLEGSAEVEQNKVIDNIDRDFRTVMRCLSENDPERVTELGL